MCLTLDGVGDVCPFTTLPNVRGYKYNVNKKIEVFVLPCFVVLNTLCKFLIYKVGITLITSQKNEGIHVLYLTYVQHIVGVSQILSPFPHFSTSPISHHLIIRSQKRPRDLMGTCFLSRTNIDFLKNRFQFSFETLIIIHLLSYFNILIIFISTPLPANSNACKICGTAFIL